MIYIELSRQARRRTRMFTLRGSARRGRKPLHFEALEARTVFSAAPVGFAVPAIKPARAGGGASPLSTVGPTGYTPAEIRHAYGFDQISFGSSNVAGNGQGTTIAIVDAYDDPKIASDLHQFDLAFGLPDPVLTEVNQSGGSALPAPNAGWANEIALDVEWAHAIAPAANILLVEANSNWFSDLFAAVDYARNARGVVAVSMSWGGSESAGESASDSRFTTPAGHGGVTFFTSAGDSGAPIGYPGASPNVVSVGGTTLNLAQDNYGSESAWSGSGGGLSAYEPEPAYQKGVVTQTTTQRANPDVAFDADPNTGFPVYNSYNNPTAAPWGQWGGTSAGAPQWAALIAIADQGRALAGFGSLDGATQSLPMIYGLPASAFHDVATGASAGTPNYSAGPGFDLATGRGSPYANVVVNALVGTSTTASAVVRLTLSVPTSTTAGSSVLLTVAALDSSGNAVTGYNGVIRFASSDGSALLPGAYTFTTADHGSHTFSLSLKTAGNQVVRAADSAAALAGNANIDIVPAAPARLMLSQATKAATAGVPMSRAVTVALVDAYGNIVTNDHTDRVTITIGANPGHGVLTGTTSVYVRSGLAVFTALTISQPGAGYTLVASVQSLPPVVSSPFSVSGLKSFASAVVPRSLLAETPLPFSARRG